MLLLFLERDRNVENKTSCHISAGFSAGFDRFETNWEFSNGIEMFIIKPVVKFPQGFLQVLIDLKRIGNSRTGSKRLK